MILDDQPFLSALIWLTVALAVLYVARTWVHRLLRRLSLAVVSLLRVTANALLSLAQLLRERNRAVLLEQAKARLLMKIERDLHRLVITADRDLANLPELKQRIRVHLDQLESDYHQSADHPLSAPDWVDAIDQVVRLRQTQSGHPIVAGLLRDMETSLNRQHRQAVAEYRKGMSHRHRLLHGLLPQWRRLHHGLDRLAHIIEQLANQTHLLDRHLATYHSIETGSDQVFRRLLLSQTSQWFFASLLLMAGLSVAWFNTELMQSPMRAVMGDDPVLAGWPLSQVAAYAMVLVYLLLGALLLETLQLTQRLDSFSALSPLQRRALAGFLLTLLLLTALAQAGLLYLREHHQSLSLYEQLIQYPVIVVQSPLLDEWLQLGATMLLGFILPFILVFLALPLERWLDASRVLVVLFLVAMLVLVASALKGLALLSRQLLLLLGATYDLLISLPLWIESRLTARKSYSEELTRVN